MVPRLARAEERRQGVNAVRSEVAKQLAAREVESRYELDVIRFKKQQLREIKTLLAKLSMMDASQQAELTRIHLEEDEKEREKAEGLREREGLEDGLAEAHARLQAAEEEVGQLQSVLQEVEAKYSHVLGLQDEAVKFSLQCLVDMRERQTAQNVFDDTRTGRYSAL